MEDENINKAKKVLETISQDERERRLTELREKYRMDQHAIMLAGYDKGLKEGIEQEKQQVAKKKERSNRSKKKKKKKKIIRNEFTIKTNYRSNRFIKRRNRKDNKKLI